MSGVFRPYHIVTHESAWKDGVQHKPANALRVFVGIDRSLDCSTVNALSNQECL